MAFRRFRWTWAGLLILMAGSLTQAVGARPTGQSSLPLAAYWRLLEETHDLVGRLAESPDDAGHEQLAEMAGRWEAVTAVTRPTGERIPINTNHLVAQLRAKTPDLNRLNNLLEAQLAARDAWPQEIHGRQALEPLTQILARPEFQWPQAQPSAFQQWVDRILERLQEFLWNLMPEGSGTISISGRIINILAALALFFVLYFALRGLIFDFVADVDISANGLVEDEVLTAESALNRAQNLSQTGDYRTAVRYLYLSTLLILEERGLLRYDRSRTNREYLRSVAQRPELAATLRDVIDVFDRVWYGFQPLDEAAYAHYAARVKDLQQQR